MSRFLLLYFGIIITTVFGLKYRRIFKYMPDHLAYLPCAPCIQNYYREGIHDKIKPFCEGCITNYNNFDYSSKLPMLMDYQGKNNDPCIDFYEFSCGVWDHANSIFQTKWSTRDNIQYRTYYYIRWFLEIENKYDNLPFIKIAKRFYGSCINKDTLEERGLEPMQQMLDATGGWPILMSEEEKNAKEITWQKMDNDYLQLYTFSILFNISYTINDGNSILMVHPSLSLPLGDKLKIDLQDENYDVYISTIMKVVKAFAKDKGIQIPELQLHTDIRDLVIFETSLLKIGYEKKIPTAGNKMTIAELQKFYDLAETQSTGKINWLDKIQIVSKFLGITVNASETVLVYDKEILHKLTYLLDGTPQHTIVNYLQWHIVRTFMGNLNEQMRDIELEHYNTSNTEIYNRTKEELRWLKCIKEFQMKDALFYLHTKTIISADALEAVSDILEDLKDRMFHYLYSKNTLQLNILMTKFIRRKIYNISLQVGYFERYDDQTAITEMYNELKIDDNYFTNVLTIIKYRNIRKQRSFHESKHKDESLRRWSFDFISDNPSYDQRTNVIHIPADMMQRPYFSLNESIAFNYGGIGSIIGQQLAHSINMHIGSYLDEFGNLKWNTTIRQIYENHLECLLTTDEYFMLDATKKPDINFQLYKNCIRNESITHFIGTQIAYSAFQEKMYFSNLEPELLNHLNPEQLFFFYNTRMICGTTNPCNKYFTNINSATEQVAGSLANTKAFSKAFKCSIGSPMRPTLRCKFSKY